MVGNKSAGEKKATWNTCGFCMTAEMLRRAAPIALKAWRGVAANSGIESWKDYKHNFAVRQNAFGEREETALKENVVNLYNAAMMNQQFP
jgi:hypothetical protein